MAQYSKIKIYVDLITGQVKRIVVPNTPNRHPTLTEDQQLAPHRAGFGEIEIVDFYSGPLDPKSIRAIVQRHTGKIAP
jgi:hypothetical protein